MSSPISAASSASAAGNLSGTGAGAGTGTGTDAEATAGRNVNSNSLVRLPPPPLRSSVETLLVAELRAELDELGLATNGRKAELVDRLLEAMRDEWLIQLHEMVTELLAAQRREARQQEHQQDDDSSGDEFIETLEMLSSKMRDDRRAEAEAETEAAARSRRRAAGSSHAGKSNLQRLQRVQQEDDGDLSSEGGQDSVDSSDDDDDSIGVKCDEMMERLRRAGEDVEEARMILREARGRGSKTSDTDSIDDIYRAIEERMDNAKAARSRRDVASDRAILKKVEEENAANIEAAAQQQLRMIADEVERQMRPLQQQVDNLRAENDLQAADILRLRAQVSRLQGEGDRETNGD